MNMRDAINGALDAAAEKDENQDFDESPQVVETSAAEETPEHGDYAKLDIDDQTAEADTSIAPDVELAASPDTSKADEGEPAPQALSGDSIKAPMDWGPQEREQWSKIPRNLQEKVMGREKELNTLMQTTVEARKTHTEFEQLANKYGSVLSGVAGDTPMAAAGNLFDTVANLRMGSPIQKAQIIADLISNFGVDINTLDSALVGAAPTADQSQQAQIEALVAQRMKPFEDQMGQESAYRQQQETKKQETAISDVQDFAKTAEFLSDVRHDMADLIDMTSARGGTITMEQAYAKACALNPQIQAVIAQRAKQTALTGGQTTMASKRAAASSLNGSRVGVGGNAEGSMRDTISSAWDSQYKI